MMEDMEHEDVGATPVRGSVVSFCHKKISKEGGRLKIGVAVSRKRTREDEDDKRNRTIEIYEFDDCDQLTNVESLLIRLNPERCYHEELDTKTNKDSGFKRRVENLLANIGLEELGISKHLFASKSDIFQDVQTLTGVEEDAELKKAIAEKQVGAAALAALIKKEEYITDDEMHGRFEAKIGELNKYMRLDAAAVEALNLFPAKPVGGKPIPQAKESSLFGVLDHCKTKKLGSRMLSRWIRQPLLDVKEIKSRQDVVEAFKDDAQRRTQVQSTLGGVPDLTRLLAKLESGKGGLKELYQLYLFVKVLPNLAKNLSEESHGESAAPTVLQGLSAQVEELCSKDCFEKYCGLIESIIDMNLAPAEFRVQLHHDETGELEKLGKKLEKIDNEKERIRQDLEEGDLSGMQPKFETDPNMLKTYGYHFRINKKHDSRLKKFKNKNYKYLNVVTACIRWGTDELRDLHEEYTEILQRLERKQASIVRDAVATAQTFMPLFEVASDIVARIDVLASLAHAAAYAGDTGYVKPKLIAIGANDSTRQIKLTTSRHPCLEQLENVDFIANDYDFDSTKSKFQIITGPNMAGKSTYCRQIGCILVMAQMGSFVPCEQAEISIVDAVFTRVGASDVLLQGLSTFMAEMVEASAIVKTATSNSFVIIDELGRGTSTYDGFGLAWAISEYLAKQVKPFCMFATHYHELTALQAEVDTVVNKHVSALATDDAVTMLYSVQNGCCNQSFGINIAKMAGFPQEVVDCAQKKADQLESLTVIGDTGFNKTSSGDNKLGKKRLRVEQAREIVSKLAKLEKAQATDANYLRQNLFAA